VYRKARTLGPLLYVTYASELQQVADRHGVAFHSFADDTQLSKSVRTEDVHAAKQALIDRVLEQITPSQAECGEDGSHLAWHATTVSQAEPSRFHPVHR